MYRGARLEAYAETKASVHTFNLCAQYARLLGTPLGKLRQEVLDIITSCLCNHAFEHKDQQWVKAQKCLDDACRPGDHLSKEDLSWFIDDVKRSHSDDDDSTYDFESRLDDATLDSRFGEDDCNQTVHDLLTKYQDSPKKRQTHVVHKMQRGTHNIFETADRAI